MKDLGRWIYLKCGLNKEGKVKMLEKQDSKLFLWRPENKAELRNIFLF